MSEWPELVVAVATLRQRDNLRDLKRRAADDSSIEVDATVQAHELEITTSRIPDGEGVHVVASISADHRGVSVRGTVDSAWEGECRRCLELVRERFTIDLDATFLESAAFASYEASPDDADAYAFDGESIDLGEVVRDELMLALPLSPLCAEDCVGDESAHAFTPESDAGRAEGEEEPPIDPRWAALSEFRFDED